MSATTETAGYPDGAYHRSAGRTTMGRWQLDERLNQVQWPGPRTFTYPCWLFLLPTGFAVPAVRAVTPGGVQTGKAALGTGAY
jgi:hypothetical protein